MNGAQVSLIFCLMCSIITVPKCAVWIWELKFKYNEKGPWYLVPISCIALSLACLTYMTIKVFG